MESITKIVWIGLILWVVEILFVSTMIHQQWLLGNIEKENASNVLYFGQKTANHLQSNTESTFNALFVDTGIRDELYYMLLPTEEARDRAEAVKGVALGDQLLGVFLVNGLAFRLAVRRVRAADIGAFIPLQPQPVQAVDQVVFGLRIVALGVGIFEAQEELPTGIVG